MLLADTEGYLLTVPASQLSLAVVQAYKTGSESDEQFVQNLALFLTAFLREHLTLIEQQGTLTDQLKQALRYLVKISYVENAGVKASQMPWAHRAHLWPIVALCSDCLASAQDADCHIACAVLFDVLLAAAYEAAQEVEENRVGFAISCSCTDKVVSPVPAARA